MAAIELLYVKAALGLVHIGNRITAHRAIQADERLMLEVRATDLDAHHRGSQFTLLTQATVDGVPVWSQHSTYLHRSGRRNEPRGGGRAGTQPPEPTAV